MSGAELPGVLVAVALVAGALALLVAVLRPTLAALLCVLVISSHASLVVGPVGPVSLLLTVMAAAVGALLLGVRQRTVRLVWSPVILLALVYVTTRAGERTTWGRNAPRVLSCVTRLARHVDRVRRAPSPSTTSRAGSWTCSPRCAARGGRTCFPGRLLSRPW